MTYLYYPLQSLRQGHWFKLICGASFQHRTAVRSFVLAYTLAGVDCIDVAADPAVVAAARDALQVAQSLSQAAQKRGFAGCSSQPLLMVSLNDGEDPHFRKAEFNPANCPADCPRPCERVCPAEAIAFNEDSCSGVIDRRCYGCGRCLPACPSQLIFTRSYIYTPQAIAPLLLETGIDAIEIHTQVGHLADFRRLWQAIAPWADKLILVAISCPDGADLIDYLRSLYQIIQPLPCQLIWQADGRPMSGDIGAGTTHATIKLAQKVIAAGLPGYVQLAGGTNNYTVSKLRSAGLLSQVAGVGYGSYARVLLSPIIDQLETRLEHNSDFSGRPRTVPPRLESLPELLWQAVAVAHSLVVQLKSPMKVLETSHL
ncbi:MAG: 4Fe-4S ferredoxin [Hormoscilla sp. SP5CHS1]|nr:4Fe-4S ferredoxin [Hormoscilla sp. SP12CHS1]MBC6454025.1 4Fe-4S ferredoxin [Hormoscilla sp. SP5CHS1]